MTLRPAFAGGVGVALLLACCAAAPAAAPGGSWLDEPLIRWNRAGAPVPAAPVPQGDPPRIGRCRDGVRPPASAEERAVADAGWAPFGPAPRESGTVVILGMTAVDGMCRPLGFQAFMFVDGHFAGTLSPVPMDSRTDGVESRIELAGPADLTVEFSRYAATDPLCCPSRLSRVTYRIERPGPGSDPVLVPVQVATTPTR